MDKLPENNLNNKKIGPSSPESRALELSRRTDSVFRRYMEKAWENIKTENKIPLFVSEVKKNVAKFVPEAKDAPEKIDAVLNFLEKKEDLIDKAIEITIRIISQHLSLEEFEKRFRKNYMKQPGRKELSRTLTFRISKEINAVSLHIPIAFFENSELFLKSFREGLHILADKMTKDPELKDIKEITGHSSLVKEKYRLLTSLGFNVTLDENGKPTEMAKISREKLLKLYGSKSKS